MTTLGDGVVVSIGDAVAVTDAAIRARTLGVPLHLVCAFRPSPPSAKRRFARRLPPGVRVDFMDEREAEARQQLSDVRETVAWGLKVRLHAEPGELSQALDRVAGRVCRTPVVLRPPARRPRWRVAA